MNQYFISYSTVDAPEIASKLRTNLEDNGKHSRKLNQTKVEFSSKVNQCRWRMTHEKITLQRTSNHPNPERS